MEDTSGLFSRRNRDQAVEALFRREYGRMLLFARVIVDDRASAEDVVQDAFAGLYGHWSSLKDDHAAVSYLRTTVANRARSHLRRRRTARSYLTPPAVDEPSAEQEAVRSDDHRRVLNALRRLPKRQREVLVLRYFFDLTEAQIAYELQISRGSVKQHASRGLAALGQSAGVTA